MTTHDAAKSPSAFDHFCMRVVATWIGLLLHALDIVTLVFRRPSLLPAYTRVLRERVALSPFPLHTYEKILAARSRGLGLRELVYGETPLWFAARALARAGANAESRVFDLGAGRGRVLLAARAIGAEARGCDVVASHVLRASEALRGTDIVVEHGDAAKADVAWATHIYMAWTCFSVASQRAVTQHLASCTPGTRVLTLTTAMDDDAFSVDGSVSGIFPWGTEKIWLHTRR